LSSGLLISFPLQKLLDCLRFLPHWGSSISSLFKKGLVNSFCARYSVVRQLGKPLVGKDAILSRSLLWAKFIMLCLHGADKLRASLFGSISR
jgi:hypothetical protein